MGGAGMTTRSSATSISSGPAISRMNGTIASATIDPSSGTSARLYMRGPLCLPRAVRDVQRGVVGANDEDRDRRAAQHRFGHASEDEAPDAAPAVGGHHDQIRLLGGYALDDRSGRRAVPHVRLDTPDSLVCEPLGDGRQIFLGLANRRDLGLDVI